MHLISVTILPNRGQGDGDIDLSNFNDDATASTGDGHQTSDDSKSHVCTRRFLIATTAGMPCIHITAALLELSAYGALHVEVLRR